jgi:hypothetical protein
MHDNAVVIESKFSRRASSEDDAEYQAFSFGRVGIKPQLTLLIRKASGAVEVFPYADFCGISSSDENLGFTLRFATRTVLIEGQRLGKLFQYICNFRTAEIMEADERTAAIAEPDKPIVWRVKW